LVATIAPTKNSDCSSTSLSTNGRNKSVRCSTRGVVQGFALLASQSQRVYCLSLWDGSSAKQ